MTMDQNQGETLHELATSGFMQNIMLPERFFQQEAEKIARACWDMTHHLRRGGRVIVFGHRSAALVHPLLVHRRAPIVLALSRHSAPLNGAANRNYGGPFTRQLRALARRQDIALGFTADGQDNDILAALGAAQEMNLLTLGLCGGDGGGMAVANLDYCFVAPGDPSVVQEIHEILYYALWELVSISFEREGLPI